MGQQEYDAFKAQMKQWMSDNADTYDEFEALMNSQSDTGYQKILVQAIALVPKYEKAGSKKMNVGSVEDTLEIEALFADENLGAKLIEEIEAIRKESIIPSAICWLFFGRSFENMVEHGEELRRNPEIPYHEKMLIAKTIKTLVYKSVELGLRTRNDWAKHHSWMKLADSEDALDSFLT